MTYDNSASKKSRTFLGSARLFWGGAPFFYAPKKPKKSPRKELLRKRRLPDGLLLGALFSGMVFLFRVSQHVVPVEPGLLQFAVGQELRLIEKVRRIWVSARAVLEQAFRPDVVSNSIEAMYELPTTA
jgi:hypothetical protein